MTIHALCCCQRFARLRTGWVAAVTCASWRSSASGVIVGGILGHMACTGLAVLMGRFIAQRIPVKWLTYVGGITFLLFGLFTFVSDPTQNA
ncbi:Transmembrane protein [Fasciola hepatica]|uniref:GDT1 family protein n=1 Tax=Fasciola hepatica TaxID=6192 RepID=A0A4E0RB71_FASHE|nr:Transmembrane protein [Fasciola hepatica]